MIPTRNIVFNFNASGFEVLEKYNETKNFCFDNLEIESTANHCTKECNVLREILLSRYELFSQPLENKKELKPLTAEVSTFNVMNFLSLD